MLTSVEKKKKKKKENHIKNNNNNKMDAVANIHVQRAATVNQNCNLKKNPFLSSLYVFVTSVFSLSLQCAQKQKKLYTQISSLSLRTL